MVVTKPEGESTDILDKPKEGRGEYAQTVDRRTHMWNYSWLFLYLGSPHEEISLLSGMIIVYLVSYLYYVNQ